MSHSIIDVIRGFATYAQAAEHHRDALVYGNPGTPEDRLREIVSLDIEMLRDYVDAHRDDMRAALDLIEFNAKRGRVCAEWVFESAGRAAGMAFSAKEEYLELVKLDRYLKGEEI